MLQPIHSLQNLWTTLNHYRTNPVVEKEIEHKDKSGIVAAVADTSDNEQ